MPQPEPKPAPVDWSDAENDLIVGAYFDMLADEIAGVPYVKAARRREVVAAIGRTEASFERKCMNVSAVMEALGLPRIKGYYPARNAQFAGLSAAIERRLESRADFVRRDYPIPVPEAAYDVYVAAPVRDPSVAKLEAGKAVERLIRKFDPAERDARNRALGRRGEEFVLKQEIDRLKAAGYDDLARRVDWVSETKGDGAGYDILSFDPTSKSERLIEVKSTYGGPFTRFWMSRNEADFAAERPDAFRLYRVFDLAVRPRIMTISPPLADRLDMQTATWSASLR